MKEKEHKTGFMVDDFYPKQKGVTIPRVSLEMAFKIRGHLLAARAGDRQEESALCNLLGSLRRSSKAYNDLSLELRTAVREAVNYLREVGRKVDFDARKNPAKWITRRDGLPRWRDNRTCL